MTGERYRVRRCVPCPTAIYDFYDSSGESGEEGGNCVIGPIGERGGGM